MFIVQQTEQFEAWHSGLKDGVARARISARIRIVQQGSLGDWKAVGDGVNELRVHHGPGYRLYFARRGQQIVLLLAGGDKSTQTKDIAAAKALLANLE